MGALDALPHFHMLMAILNRDGREKIQIGPMDNPLIGEYEAILLALWHAAAADQSMHAKTILTLIVAQDAVSTAAMALRQAVAHLANAALLPRLTN